MSFMHAIVGIKMERNLSKHWVWTCTGCGRTCREWIYVHLSVLCIWTSQNPHSHIAIFITEVLLGKDVELEAGRII